jgi:hypothetical protein
MLTRVCLLRQLVERRFQRLRRNQNNLVGNEDSNALNNDVTIVGGNVNNDHNNAEEMLHHSMMLHGLVLLSLMLEMASLQDLQKNH